MLTLQESLNVFCAVAAAEIRNITNSINFFIFFYDRQKKSIYKGWARPIRYINAIKRQILHFCIVFDKKFGTKNEHIG